MWKVFGAPVPEYPAFPLTDDTHGMARSVRHARCFQLGKTISDSLSRPASIATGADGSHQMSNKLSLLAFDPSPMLQRFFIGKPGRNHAFSERAVRWCESRADAAESPNSLI
jgi:hypothetical protein